MCFAATTSSSLDPFLGVLKQVVQGHFEPYLAHVSPCKFPKTLEMGNFRTDSAYRGVQGECDGGCTLEGAK